MTAGLVSLALALGQAGPVANAADETILHNDFESTAAPWRNRGAATITLTDQAAHAGSQSLLVADRAADWQGVECDASGLLVAGGTYSFDGYVRLVDGQPATTSHFTVQRVDASGATQYEWIGGAVAVTADGWSEIGGTYQLPAGSTSVVVYVEAAPAGGVNPSFYLDDIVITGSAPAPVEIQDVTPIKDTTPFPVGVAIDSRETVWPGSDLLLKHFNQITPENHMKPEAWYDQDRNFRLDPQAQALMDFAQANDLRLYGHTLVWHSQTPAWFFSDENGAPLTDSAADKALLTQRLHDHITNVARTLAESYGPFGSATNPLVAFDVVNEVVDDGTTTADGLRRSPWYTTLGPDYIKLAFQYADEAFNQTYADPAAERPVSLFINDYNTEQSGKRARYLALVQQLLAEGAPVDGVGHQFHSTLDIPVSYFDDALTAFQGLGLKQAVTELDVPTGTPVTEANLIEQGYYYRDAFDVFRDHAADLFSVTLWGLTDGRSWRDDRGAPLAFDNAYQTKPAYCGIVGAEHCALPALVRQADVFAGPPPDQLANACGVLADQLADLPQHPMGEHTSFQARWNADGLTVLLRAQDYAQAGVAAASADISLTLGDQTWTVHRDGSGDLDAAVFESPCVDAAGLSCATTWYAIAVPAPGLVIGDTAGFDLSVAYSGAGQPAAEGWNTPGAWGTLTFVESLSRLTVPPTTTAPVIDGLVDAVWFDGLTPAVITAARGGAADADWAAAGVVWTDKLVEGTGGATALAATLWRGQTLYVLMDVTDPVVDVSGSDPWVQDSVEIYVDRGNQKNGAYLTTDTQIRISADNALSFGRGATEAEQRALVTSATVRTATGYLVEAAIDLGPDGGPGTYQGLDFQVNDATAGARGAIHNWADPTNNGYQSTARWGVGRLDDGLICVDAQDLTLDQPTDGAVLSDPRPTVSGQVEPGYTVVVSAGDDNTCQTVADAQGAWSCVLPQALAVGRHDLTAVAIDPTGWWSQTVTVQVSVPAVEPPVGPQGLPDTGTRVLPALPSGAALLVLIGLVACWAGWRQRADERLNG
jgi:endo-1,4-beta-xylanase